MSCPECQDRFREYLIFRSSVARFAGHLEDMENERRRILEERRPEGAPPLIKVKATLRCREGGPTDEESRSSRQPRSSNNPSRGTRGKGHSTKAVVAE
jgi:hypothetical protein